MKRNILAFASAVALVFVAAKASAQTDSEKTTARAAAPTAPAAPAKAPATISPAELSKATPNDVARFLAGMAPSADSPLIVPSAEKTWADHAKFFDTAWADLDKKQLAKVRAWAASYIPDASKSNAPLFYMFSGPDYLYANAFFPNASTYILCGIEPVGTMPDIGKIKPGTLGNELHDLQNSLNSVLSFSFFITKDMKNDLQNHEINGTLPLILIFVARAGNTINDVSFVGIDSDGKVRPVDDPAKSHLIPGAKITFTQPNAAQPQMLYYFDTDISDDGIKHTPGFLKYCQSLAPGDSFVKSASYLMHENYFATIRNFLLKNSLTLVQDDSGIPISYFTPDQWALRYFGSYPGPIDLFKKDFQPQLSTEYKKSHPIPLDFGIGYRHYASQSTLILATHKPAGNSPTTPSAVPATPAASPAASPAAAPATSQSAPTSAPLASTAHAGN
ncbi:MAG TPA: hypothetical protein VG733_13585 [Chthoniobacteraceae bacterium]|nr:hypothetical protein [Chthoniobacteraceae bacterium]